MKHRIRSRKRKREELRWKLLAALIVSLMLLSCVLLDCWKKGLFTGHHKKQEKLSQKESSKEEQGNKRDSKTIRVLLTNSGQSSIFHEAISVTGSRAFTVEKKGKKETYEAGKEITFQRKEVKAAGEGITLHCPEGKLKVTSIRRRQRIPAYRGTLKLVWDSHGIVLVNELPLGQYLYGVVPSEMSADYPMEALKAQAVCARSYAWRQMKSEKYEKYGADVDDTTAYQVYGMADEDARTRRAVKKTAGELLFHGDNVITAYYYSTSWGCSADTEEVWGGGEHAECYPRKLQITEESREETKFTSLDLSDEKIFGSFITDSLCHTYDQDSSWYRWKVFVTAKELGARMGIGTVENIQVLERGKSGLLRQVKVIGTNGRRTITGQQDIRERMMVSGRLVEKQDGSKTELSMLPSAAFLIQAGADQDGVYFLFTGGGFGHGTGMSQNGAAGMAKEGKNYREILMHYYSNCKIK